MRLSKAESERKKALKELEALAQKVKKKNWKTYKGTELYKQEFKEKNKRKKKKISDVTKGINILDKKLDKIIKENIKLKEEISDIKLEQKKMSEHKQKEHKQKIDKPKSIIELQRQGGNKIDMDTYIENVKLKDKLNKEHKKETK